MVPLDIFPGCLTVVILNQPGSEIILRMVRLNFWVVSWIVIDCIQRPLILRDAVLFEHLLSDLVPLIAISSISRRLSSVRSA
jgi:hypothetical protein